MANFSNNKVLKIVGLEDDYPHTYESSKQFINELTNNCDEVQLKVLGEILNQNEKTEYMKRHGIIDGCIDRETFKTKVPIITYEDIKHDIHRICNEKFSPILCARPFTELWISSGTSEGQQKLFPITEEEKERRDKLFFAVTPYIKRCIEGEETYNGKSLSFFITRDGGVTPSGLKICAGTTSFFKNLKFYKDKPYPYNSNTSPKEAILCNDHFQSIYAQLLCGFYQRHDVTHAKSIFGSSFIWVIHFLKRYYVELCHDISSGSLNNEITDPVLREYMVKTFMQKPLPELAKFIEKTCMEENWEGIYRKIWPNIKYLDSVLTGSMTQYIPMLKYYTGGVPLLSVKYSASECDLGFNLDPMCDPYDVTYTIMPNMSYYEFIPLESSDFTSFESQPRTVDLANVEVGKEYELVITNFCGLHRFRIGDVLSPVGFYNSTPQFKFVRRKNVLLTIDICKTTEMELQNAIDTASSLLAQVDTKIVEYTSYADMKKTPGHYVVYMELMTTFGADLPKKDVMEQCCLDMEGALGVLYKGCRVDGSVGPIEIRVVNNKSFEKLRDYAISNGASFTQFKVPRCVKVLAIIELLNSGVVSTHFSPSPPHDAPNVGGL